MLLRRGTALIVSPNHKTAANAIGTVSHKSQNGRQRKDDHQAFVREFIFDIKDGKHRILEVVPKEKTLVPPDCKFSA